MLRFYLLALISIGLASPTMAQVERKALVDKDGNVVNVIALDPKASYTPAPGLALVPAQEASEPGGHYDAAADSFTAKPPPTQEELDAIAAKAAQSPDAKIEALQKQIDELNTAVGVIEAKPASP